MKMNRAKKLLGVFSLSLLLLVSSPYLVQAAPHPLEHTGYGYQAIRVEHEEGGIVYNVGFTLNGRPMGGSGGIPCTVLDGQGIGREQWPADPIREHYTFVGWYDNEERTGEAYSMNTPIYKDTILYAKWKYSGPGGYWPRPYRGTIHGMEEGSNYNAGQSITITAEGYNMHLTSPSDQRFRWVPIGWRISGMAQGNFKSEQPFTSTFNITVPGEYVLSISYKEDIFDGMIWQETGQVRETEEVTFQIK